MAEEDPNKSQVLKNYIIKYYNMIKKYKSFNKTIYIK